MAGGRNQYGLTVREERFCLEVAKGVGLVQAALNAGYDGDAGNANRRAAKTKIQMRIAQLREQLRENLALQRSDAEAEATETLKTRGVTLDWLIDELRTNLNLSRADGKFKDANESIKLIAQIAGFVRSGDSEKNPNQYKPGQDSNGSNASPTVAVQIINQAADIAERRARDSSQARETAIPDRSGGHREPHQIPGPAGATPLPQLDAGPIDDAVYESVEDGGT